VSERSVADCCRAEMGMRNPNRRVVAYLNFMRAGKQRGVEDVHQLG